MGFEWTWLGKQNTRWNKYSPLWIHKAPQARSAKRCGRRPKAEGGAEGEAEGMKREALKARSAAGAEGVKREAPKESKASKQFNNRLFSTGWDGGGSLFSWSGTCKQPVDGMDWKHQGSFRHLCRGGGGVLNWSGNPQAASLGGVWKIERTWLRKQNTSLVKYTPLK